MDVQIGKRKFVLEQTWGEFKAFVAADNGLDLDLLKARDADDYPKLTEVHAERIALHEAQVAKCLQSIDGAAVNGSLDALQWDEPHALARKLLNPSADLNEQPAPFARPPASG